LSADMHRGQRASRGNQANHALKAGYKGAADFFATQHKFFLLPGRHPYKTTMPLTVPEITRLLKVRGDHRNALQPVSPLEHALQCAQLAEQALASDELIVAALLHDLGHLLRSDQGPRPGHSHPADELHPAIAVSCLRGLLPESVLAPIRLQFDARRHVRGDHPGFWTGWHCPTTAPCTSGSGCWRAELLGWKLTDGATTNCHTTVVASGDRDNPAPHRGWQRRQPTPHCRTP
jgi:hypothetical protein